MLVRGVLLQTASAPSQARPTPDSGLTLEQIRQFLAHDVIAWVLGGLVAVLVVVVVLWAMSVSDRQPSRLITASVGAVVVILGVVFALRADALGREVPVLPVLAIGLGSIVLLEVCQGLSVRLQDVAHNLAQYLLLVLGGVITVVLLTRNVDDAMWLLYGAVAGAGSYFAVLGPNRSIGRTVGRHFAPDGPKGIVTLPSDREQVA